MKFLGALPEGHEPGAGCALFKRGGLACVDRVETVRHLLAGPRGELARQRERHRAQLFDIKFD